MQLFYLPNVTTGLMDLPSEEARHIVQVLRKRDGDEIQVVDGQGKWYKGVIHDAEKRRCSAVFELIREENKRCDYELTIGISIVKNRDRLEWFLEKATEIGVDHIVPLFCKRTERSKVNMDRCEKIITSAMKQSLQAWKPNFAELTPLKDFLTQQRHHGNRFIGWCEDETKALLSESFETQKDVTILIGPEGDFTQEEVQLAKSNGFQPISLGANRYRTESAGIIAAHTIEIINNLKR